MDTKNNRQMCWEITGCSRQDVCKVLKLALASDKPCWDVVADFDDYRSALNVCGDCIVSVLSRQHSLDAAVIEELKQEKAKTSTHHSCPGLTIS